jgi:hypothetical protein
MPDHIQKSNILGETGPAGNRTQASEVGGEHSREEPSNNYRYLIIIWNIYI